jgi:hypothetical protein
MNYISVKNLPQKINYIVVHIVITVVAHFLGQKVELMTQGVLKTHGICLMMYFKNNWNVGPFFLIHGYFRRKKTYIYIYIYIDFQTCMNI